MEYGIPIKRVPFWERQVKPVSQQELHYAELRLDKLTSDYLNACHTSKDFQHSSIGIKMEEKMAALNEIINPPSKL